MSKGKRGRGRGGEGIPHAGGGVARCCTRCAKRGEGSSGTEGGATASSGNPVSAPRRGLCTRPTPLPQRRSRQPGRGNHPGVCRGERSAWTTMPRGREEAGRPAGRSGAGVMLREPSQSRRTNSARFHPRELLKTGKFVEAEKNGGFQGLGSGDRGSNQQAWRFG